MRWLNPSYAIGFAADVLISKANVDRTGREELFLDVINLLKNSREQLYTPQQIFDGIKHVRALSLAGIEMHALGILANYAMVVELDVRAAFLSTACVLPCHTPAADRWPVRDDHLGLTRHLDILHNAIGRQTVTLREMAKEIWLEDVWKVELPWRVLDALGNDPPGDLILAFEAVWMAGEYKAAYSLGQQ
jgi:hypothetical protein